MTQWDSTYYERQVFKLAIEVSYQAVPVPDSETGEEYVEVTFMLDPDQLWQLITSLSVRPEGPAGQAPYIEQSPSYQLQTELAQVRSELGWTNAPNPPVQGDEQP